MESPETIADPRKVEFSDDRKNLIIEIGHGGPTTIILPGISSYLKEKDSNYLGIEPSVQANEAFNLRVSKKNIDWAKNLNTSVFKLDSRFNGIAKEVWLRNFRGVGLKRNSSLQSDLFEKAYDLLEDGGLFLVVNTYDNVSLENQQGVEDTLKSVGFEVQRIDMEKDTHPFISKARERDRKFLPNDIPGIESTPFGFIATKPEV